MGLALLPAASSVSPLPLGEVELPRRRASAVRCNSGEGLRPIDRPYPLTPTLSRSKSDISDFDYFKCPTRVNPSWVERVRTAAVAKSFLQRRGGEKMRVVGGRLKV